MVITASSFVVDFDQTAVPDFTPRNPKMVIIEQDIARIAVIVMAAASTRVATEDNHLGVADGERFVAIAMVLAVVIDNNLSVDN